MTNPSPRPWAVTFGWSLRNTAIVDAAGKLVADVDEGDNAEDNAALIVAAVNRLHAEAAIVDRWLDADAAAGKPWTQERPDDAPNT